MRRDDARRLLICVIMSIKGRVVAAVAIRVAAVAAGVILLWPALPATSAEPTPARSDSSEKLRIYRSGGAGLLESANIAATGRTPDEQSCKAAWDNLPDSEKQDLLYGPWTAGCVDG